MDSASNRSGSSWFPSFSWSTEKPNIKQFKFFTLRTGNTLNSHHDVMDRLKKRLPVLHEVPTEAECDIILAFCPVVRVPAVDIKAALEKLNQNSDTKPAVLVVLHHTFDPDYVTSDSSRAVKRENTITADCLFHEDQGLLKCHKNEESLAAVIDFIELQIGIKNSVEQRMEVDQYRAPSGKPTKEFFKGKKKNIPSYAPVSVERYSNPGNQEMAKPDKMKRKFSALDEKPMVKYFVLLAGKTLNCHEVIIVQLKGEIRQLQVVDQVDMCDFILAFCPVVSRAGTDIEAALEKLNHLSAVKPAVLVMLHRTFDPECFVPDSNRAVNRRNTITVDCLFHEDHGLLRSKKNDDSLTRIINYINTQSAPILSITEQPNLPTKRKHKYFIQRMENTAKALMERFAQMSDLQEVETEDECDFILILCPVVWRDGTDFKRALAKLESYSVTKPVPVLAMYQDQDYVALGAVNNEHTFLRDQKSMQRSTNGAGAPTQCSDELENTLEAESSTSALKTTEKDLQDKDKQLEDMRVQMETLKTKVAEEKEEKHRLRREISQEEIRLEEVRLELANTTKELQVRKEQLGIVNKLLNDGIEIVEVSKNKMESLGKEMQDRSRQIQERKPPEYNESPPKTVSLLEF